MARLMTVGWQPMSTSTMMMPIWGGVEEGCGEVWGGVREGMIEDDDGDLQNGDGCMKHLKKLCPDSLPSAQHPAVPEVLLLAPPPHYAPHLHNGGCKPAGYGPEVEVRVLLAWKEKTDQGAGKTCVNMNHREGGTASDPLWCMKPALPYGPSTLFVQCGVLQPLLSVHIPIKDPDDDGGELRAGRREVRGRGMSITKTAGGRMSCGHVEGQRRPARMSLTMNRWFISC